MDLLGIPYPIQKTALGLLPSINGREAIKADLLQLLLTNPGERVMLPNFGTALRSLTFEQNTVALANKARALIIEAIQNWEPRIVVTEITVKNQGTMFEAGEINPDSIGNELYIKISYTTPDSISETDTLVVQLPIGAQ